MEDNKVDRQGKPLQRVSYAAKQANKQQFYKDTADWYIAASNFEKGTSTASPNARNIRQFYEVYNNQLPLEWFKHVTDPLSAKKSEHKNFPTKIRPTTILRTNIDLLAGEYPRRPFAFHVSNLGDDGYNSYLDGLNKAVNDNLQKHFMQIAMQTAKDQGIDMTSDEGQQQLEQLLANFPTPEDVATAYKASYKDKQAIRGQNWLNRALVENDIRRIQHKMFKDWLIAGEAYSYKGIRRGKLEYRRISPLQIAYDKSEDQELVEDGEWAVIYYPMTNSDIVDMFYDSLKEDDHKKLENDQYFGNPGAFFSYLNGVYNDKTTSGGKTPVYHVMWKGKQKIRKITYQDPLTGEQLTDTVGEDYILDKAAGETEEIMWGNIGHEAWVIGDASVGRIYLEMGEFEHQRNEMNNFSSLKLPVNGKRYSDTHANNISVLEIGIPFQILYIIVTRSLELTIAKSKGKILFMDKATIPKTGGWDEEKFFYYAEALGYGLLDRNQIGVDKSYNQYKVEDLTLYDSIKQLIELQAHLKQEWDDILGINRQRKGQTYASDTVGSGEQALFQSTVITDMIFKGFEDFVQKELQGMLDLSKFINLDGTRKLYNQTEFEYELLEIDGTDYANSEMGVFVTDSSTENLKLQKMEAYATNRLAQNPDAKPSTILEVVSANNVSKLRSILHKIEEAEAQAAQAMSQNEQEAQKAIEETKMKYMQYEKQLDTMFMQEEYDRKAEIEHIKGEYSLFNAGKANDGDNNNNSIPDSAEIAKNQIEVSKIQSGAILEQQKLALADKHKQQDLANSEADRQNKLEIEKLKAKTALKNKVVGQK